VDKWPSVGDRLRSVITGVAGAGIDFRWSPGLEVVGAEPGSGIDENQVTTFLIFVKTINRRVLIIDVC
jgi:hypothetical protein